MIIPSFTWEGITARTGGDVAIILSESQQYLLMQLLSFIEQNPEQFLTDYADYDPDDINHGIDATMNALLDSNYMTSLFSSRLVFWGAEMKILAGNGWQWNELVGQDFDGYWRQSVAAQNDELEIFVAVPPGTYRIDLFGIKFSGAAKQTIKWNGNTIPDIDWYSSSTLIRQLVQPSYNMIVTGSEGLTINSKVNSRNASNTTGWYIGLTWMKIRKTA